MAENCFPQKLKPGCGRMFRAKSTVPPSVSQRFDKYMYMGVPLPATANVAGNSAEKIFGGEF
jgi:hypothetical protein